MKCTIKSGKVTGIVESLAGKKTAILTVGMSQFTLDMDMLRGVRNVVDEMILTLWCYENNVLMENLTPSKSLFALQVLEEK